MISLDSATAARWARMILDALHRPYPYHLVHAAASDAEVRAPRELTPAFYGCYDWHSAVHGHWSVVRLLRLFPGAAWAGEAEAAISRSLTPQHIATEVNYQRSPHRSGFERPYGLAWLLQLAAELREASPQFGSWMSALEPLESLAAERLSAWLPKLPFPIRAGEHSQTAFSLGLCLDWARTAGNSDFERLICERATTWYGHDCEAPVDYEPSGHDFLSPTLGEADLMRRILPATEFHQWLSTFLPPPCLAGPWLRPVTSPDPADGKLAHLDGLNLSRAWMLEGIASALPGDDPAREKLLSTAASHATAGLAATTGEHYASSHWLGTFAIYLSTCRGLT